MSTSPECLNCGPTTRAMMGKGLCSRCYRIDKIRKRFDEKDRPEEFKWTAKTVSELRHMRIVLRLNPKTIALHFQTTAHQIRLALKKYGIKVDFAHPKTEE